MGVMKTLAIERRGGRGGGYPAIGERVRVVGSWKGKAIDVTGIVLASRRNPKSAAFMVRGGAVLAVIRTDTGQEVKVPWSVNYVSFQRAA